METIPDPPSASLLTTSPRITFTSLISNNLGFAVDYNPLFFILLIVVVIYFHVNWSLAFVVVVVESKRGIEALMRSSYLIKGTRSVSLILLLSYGTFCGLLVWVLTDSLHEFNSWVYVFFTMLGSSYLVWFLLQITTANTVLYNYCKELHGELATGSAEGFAHEYLLASDEKVPCVATATKA
ncbi:hypothetical protein CTI12_AA457640 [Artemisia annua]|uniref:Uncharacterized protein n=1 Tax=Artemisia annua TaxID=35608 RepID=A0A2U1LT08_ARTAN|nr:hypothetical protein CTI12_AA457640 [Artemisia annua]